MDQGINLKYNEIIPFIKENKERFYRFAYRYMRNADASVEVVQESIVKSLEKVHTLKKRKCLKTWFYKILINECLACIKKSKKFVFLQQYNEISYTDNTTSKNEINNIVFKAIDNLDAKYKTIIILRFYEEMTISDISKVLGVNINTVKSRLYRALSKLRRDLKNEDMNDLFSSES